MNRILLLIGIVVLKAVSVFATTTVLVGASQAHTTIEGAYNSCTGSTDYAIEIQGDYNYNTESYNGDSTITLGALSNKSASNTVTIRPATGVTLSFTGKATSIFTLDGADWVIFDGRAGGSGASAWTISNSATTYTAGISVISFYNDASNNILKYCTLKGDAGCYDGVIFFSTTTGSTGNDSNTIDHCTIREYSGLPTILIRSHGTMTKENSGNVVSNCNLLNFKNSAIHSSSASDTWTISNNSFYQTASQTVSAQAVIWFAYNNGGNTITGNYIGGQAPNCGGSAYTVNCTSGGFYGVFFSDSYSTSGVNTIGNNTIANLNITTNYTDVVNLPPISMIYTSGAGNFVIGSTGNGNTIGSTSGTGNITIHYTNSNFCNTSFGAIQATSNGTHSIVENTIGSIAYNESITNGGCQITLIQVISTGDAVIDNNTLGNSTANNITITSNSNLLAGVIIGNLSISNLTISNNLIQNLTIENIVNGTRGSLFGIYTQGSSIATLSLTGNTVKSLTINTANPLSQGVAVDIAEYTNAYLQGIYLTDVGSVTATRSIYGNRIFDLVSNYSGNTDVHIAGLVMLTSFNGGVNIYRNKIRNLSNASTNPNSGVIGMFLSNSGTANPLIYNNIVLLSDGANTNSKALRGIINYNYNSSSQIFHNTVKLFANYTSGTGISSAYTETPTGNSVIIKNNVFQNATTGGAGSHYAQLWDFNNSSAGSMAGIRNNYNESPLSSTLVNWNGTDEDITAWNAEISSGTELTGGISISSTTGAPSTTSIIGGAGAQINVITDDYDLNSRTLASPWIGAFEVITPLGVSLTEIAIHCLKSKKDESIYGATINWNTTDEKNNDFFTLERSEDGFIWEVRDTINGSGTTFQKMDYSYFENFENLTPESQKIMYYRLSQTDFNGEKTLLKTFSCSCQASDKIKLHPVPATESVIINFGDQNNIPNSFQVMDMYGRKVEEVIVPSVGGHNTTYTLNIQNYSSGRYIVIINDWPVKEDAIFIKE